MNASNRRKFLWCAGGPLAALLGLELALRAFDWAPAAGAPFRLVDSNLAEQLDREGSGMAFDPRWLWAPIPGAFVAGEAVNAAGFRGPLPAAGERPALRILALGESATFGLGLLDRESWPRALERKLRDRGIDAQVLNYGVIGHSIVQGVERYCVDGVPWRADVVLCCFGGRNEQAPSADRWSDQERIARMRSAAWRWRRKLGGLATVRWLAALGRPAAREIEPDGAHRGKHPARVSLQEYERALARLRDVVRSHGGDLLVVIQAFRPDHDAMQPIFGWYAEGIERAAAGLGLPVANVRAALQRRASGAESFAAGLFRDEAHPSAEGSAWMAEVVLSALQAAGLARADATGAPDDREP
jgi:lysophospholipase L1-like esterase